MKIMQSMCNQNTMIIYKVASVRSWGCCNLKRQMEVVELTGVDEEPDDARNEGSGEGAGMLEPAATLPMTTS